VGAVKSGVRTKIASQPDRCIYYATVTVAFIMQRFLLPYYY